MIVKLVFDTFLPSAETWVLRMIELNKYGHF